jgi:hypothetical protein
MAASGAQVESNTSLGGLMDRQLANASIGVVMAWVLVKAHAAGAPDPLTSARTLWMSMAPKSYSYVVEEHAGRVFWYCNGPNSTEFSTKEARITVRDGRVVRVASIRNNEFPESCLKALDLHTRNLHTIEGLFEFIEHEQAANGGRPNMATKYDARFGFPSYVSERDVLDGSAYTVKDFRILN